jgi:hypothetical protein
MVLHPCRLLVAGAKAAGIHLEAKQWSWQHVEGLEIIIKKVGLGCVELE